MFFFEVSCIEYQILSSSHFVDFDSDCVVKITRDTINEGAFASHPRLLVILLWRTSQNLCHYELHFGVFIKILSLSAIAHESVILLEQRDKAVFGSLGHVDFIASPWEAEYLILNEVLNVLMLSEADCHDVEIFRKIF